MPTEIKPFQIDTSEKYVTLRLSGFCDPKNLKEFLVEFKPFMEGTIPDVVVNCEKLLYVSGDWIRQLIKIQITLKEADKVMRLILVNGKLMQQFRAEGVDGAFKFCATLKEALEEMGYAQKKLLDTNFVNPFLTATMHVLKVQARIEATAGKIYLKENKKLLGDISGVIGIVSESFHGSVVISFPEKTFLAVMSNMIGEKYSEISQDIIDGAGELTNMIFGQAKVVLNDKGYGIKTALPSVITGKDHQSKTITNGPIVIVPFTSSEGDFFIEICIS